MKIKPLKWQGPRDVARCSGWSLLNMGRGPLKPHPECLDCLRRAAPGGEWQLWQSAPEFDGVCPDKITEESRSK